MADVSTTNSTDSVTTTTDTGNCKDVNFMKSAASIKRRLLASKKFVDQLMAEAKIKRARLHRLREETLASRKRQEDRDIAMVALALALEKGEKIHAEKEKQMKEEEAVVEAVLRLLQTIKVIVSLRKPCVKVLVILRCASISCTDNRH